MTDLAGLHVLLVEDDAPLREELGQFLSGHDLNVVTATGVEDTKEKLRRQRFNVILLDLWLDQESGFDILMHVRRKSNTPCIIMSAQDNIRQSPNLLKKQAADYILKPIHPQELLARISAACKRAPTHEPANFIRDNRASISIMGALSLAALVAIAGIVVDAGALYYARLKLQSTSDAAALAAVQNPSNAASVTAAVFANNGYSTETLSVVTGVYTPNESLSVQNRFTPSATGINAVQVNVSLKQPAFFSAYFGMGPDVTLATESTAARIATASFGVGTGVASLNAGLLNSLLGQLWGSSLSLSLIDYQALATTNIQALSFLNQLATDINFSGGYQQLAAAQVTVGQILTAMIETVQASGGQGNPTAALLALQTLQGQNRNNASVLLSNVMNMSALYGRNIGDVIPASNSGLGINLMSLVSASARTLANGQLVDIGTAITVPITNSTISTKLAIGSPMAQTAAATPVTTLQTAQIRMAINAQVASLNLIVATATVQVAVYLEAAAGQASLIALPCTSGGTLAQISASSGLANLQFGTVSDAALTNFSTPVTPTPAPVVNVSLLGIPVLVNISGGANLLANGPQTLNFSQTDIDNGQVWSVPSGGATPFKTLSLGFILTPNVANIPLINGLLSTLLSGLQPVVASLLAQLDVPISQVLTTLGIALGTTDVQVFDVNCRTPTLVR